MNHPFVKWATMAALAIIWGSSFILMKRGLMDFTPGQVAAARMFISFLCLLPFVIGNANKIKSHQWKFIFATGILGNCAPAFLFTAAQTVVPSFIAGMLNSLVPLFTLILGYIAFQTKVTINKIAGVGLGLAGAVSLILISSDGHLANVSWYPVLIVIATIMYACSVNIIRHKLNDVDAILISGFALSLVGPPSGIYLFSTDFLSRFENHPHAWESFAYISLLAIFGTAISIVLFNKLIKVSGALFASSVTYLIPVVAMIWGLVDGEKPGWFHLVALAAILGGVYLINSNRNIPEKPSLK